MNTVSSENWWVTPKRRLKDIPKPITLETKIEIFCERTNGWKIDIANDISSKRDPDNYYAILDIILNYFEMIAKYYEGYTGTYLSKKFFMKGLFLVFPEIRDITSREPKINKSLEKLYFGARCGTYHIGFPNSYIFLEDGTIYPIRFLSNGTVTINPHQLVKVVKRQFNEYITNLKDTNNKTLRQNFEKRFDLDTSTTTHEEYY